MHMTPQHAFWASPLGELTIVTHQHMLTGIYFAEHSPAPTPDSLGKQVNPSSDPLLLTTQTQLLEYFSGSRTIFDLPIATNADQFSADVWAILSTIPYGTTTTYGAIAATLGQKQLAQRVGQAIAKNPIMIVIPCHRVVGANGTLTGYAGGLARKRELLTLEEPAAAATSRLF